MALERQVHVEGQSVRLPASELGPYCTQRPLGSRIGAWASPQSEVIADRAALEQRYVEAAGTHGELRFSEFPCLA